MQLRGKRKHCNLGLVPESVPKIPKMKEKKYNDESVLRDTKCAINSLAQEFEDEQFTPLPQRSPTILRIQIPKLTEEDKRKFQQQRSQIEADNDENKDQQFLEPQFEKTPRFDDSIERENALDKLQQKVQKMREGLLLGQKLEFQSPVKHDNVGNVNIAGNSNDDDSNILLDTVNYQKQNKNNADKSSGQSTTTNYQIPKKSINQSGVLNSDETNKLLGNNKIFEDRYKFRHEVVNIYRGENSQDDVTVRLRNMQDSEFYLQLQYEWATTPLEVGDIINLVFFDDEPENIPQDSNKKFLELNLTNGLLILHPDMLISGTTISEALTCQRKAVFKHLISGPSGDKAVQGIISHELFQSGLQLVKDFKLNQTEMNFAVEQIVKNHVMDFFEVGMDEEGAREFLKEQVPKVIDILNQYANFGALQLVSGVAANSLQIIDVLDIEENIWAPKFGIKGQLDASLKIKRQKQQNSMSSAWQCSSMKPKNPTIPENQNAEKIVPFEFKSGKEFYTHQAQVILYNLLIQERYMQGVSDEGILWYINNPQFEEIKSTNSNLCSIMNVRNHVAHFLSKKTDRLPPILAYSNPSKAQFSCSKCPVQQLCALNRKFEGEGDDRKDGSEGLPPQLESTIQVSESWKLFIKKWLRLVDLEEFDCSAKKPQIWSITGNQREEQFGSCISNLKLLQYQGVLDGRHTYLFSRDTNSPKQQIELFFQSGDYGVLSVEGFHPGLMRCNIVNCSKNNSSFQILLGLYKKLKNSYPVKIDQKQSEQSIYQLNWRLDRDEVASQFPVMRRNLFEMVVRKERLTQLIIDLIQPTTEQNQNISSDINSNKVIDKFKCLNEQQKIVLQKILGGLELTLIQGMPGTGKTTTIVQLTKALIQSNRKVLLSSYTNSALDNILKKLIDDKVQVLRLGRSDRTHESVAKNVLGQGKFQYNSVQDLKRIAQTVSVVGVTCLSVHHPLVLQSQFDVCIMDEASQVNLPTCLGPLLYAKQIVLVGDHCQLPPVIRSKQANSEGMAVSLFQRLYEHHSTTTPNPTPTRTPSTAPTPTPSCTPTISLTHQYRMNACNMYLSNKYFYNNKLVCGSSLVANQTLEFENKNLIHQQKLWIQSILKQQNKVIFVNTDQLSQNWEIQIGDGVYNITEIKVIQQILRSFNICGRGGQSSIGILSPFNKQVSSLSENFRENFSEAELSGVEILTIDKSQGREMDCVVVSWVKSNPDKDAGILLQDWRRINVAITRARKKLVFVGSANTLKSNSLLNNIISEIQYTHLDGFSFVSAEQQ